MDLLKSLGYELTEISEKTGISFQTLNQIKRGITQKPRAYNLKALADAFGYELKYIDGEPHFFEKKAETSEPFRLAPADTSLPPIPIIAIGEAGARGINLEEQLGRLPINFQKQYAEGKYFEGDGEHFVTRPVDVRDITAYAVIVEGDSMSPLINPGAIVIASPIKQVVSGDLCIVKMKNNSTYIKKVYFQEDGFVILKSFNPNYQDKYKPRDEIEFCHKVVWIRM